MHLRNFCQVSIEEVRQVMTRSPVKVPLSTETVKGTSVENWRQLKLRTPCEKCLATPLHVSQQRVHAADCMNVLSSQLFNLIRQGATHTTIMFNVSSVMMYNIQIKRQ